MRVLPTQVLLQRAQSRPEGTAFVFQENVWTYRRLAQESERVAQGLAASAKSLAPYKVPEGLRVIGALPRNALSKIDRRALERMIGEDENAGSRSEAALRAWGG
jgi:long-chain acyl-CoA synthetase